MATVGQPLLTPESGWKRYNDTDGRIKYNGTWTSDNNSSTYLNTQHYSNILNDNFTFKFYGTKLRILGALQYSRSSNVMVNIDGVDQPFYSEYIISGTIFQALFFEKNNLSLGVHTVTVTNKESGKYMDLDAIDIDDTGDLLGTGIALTAPESGWRRYDDTDSRIKYTNFTRSTPSTGSYYKDTVIASADFSSKIKFKFYGTKLRIIDTMYTDRTTSVSISIDGVIETYNVYATSALIQRVVYEKILSTGIHSIIITKTSNDSKGFGLDAIDIDNTGYLVHPTLNQVSDINSMQIGDCIPCRYTANATGSIGYFSELGACIADEIPVTGLATPNGLFYLICVGKDQQGKKKYIADRNIQHSISWDTLNNAGIVFGKTTGPYFKEYDGKKAIYMNGTDEVLKKVNPSIPDLSAFTIEVLWDINSVANASAHYPSAFSFTSETGATNNRINLYIDPQTGGSGTELGWNDGTSNDLRKTAAVPSGLNHFALTYDGATLSEYRNGVLYNSASVLNKIIKLSANTLLLGKGIGYPGGVVTSAYINGVLYYFRVWNKALTLDQINTNKYKCKLNDNSIVYSLNENDYDIATLQSKFPTMVGIDSSNIVIADKNKILRLPTGGVSSTDIDNEWDNIIINSTLNNKITANDNNVWHHSLTLINVRSTTATTPTAGNTNRTYRVDSWGYGTSDLANANLGFRPVLLMEMTDKFLIKKDSNYYSIDPKYYDEVNHEFTPLSLSGGSVPNKSDIEIFGFDSLNLLISSITKGSDTIKPIDKFANCEIKYYTMT